MRWHQRFFRRELTEKHLDAELRFHLDQRVADLVSGGMAAEEARRRARLEFGGLDQVKEECRDVGGSQIIETFIQDIRYGLRQLRRNPGFATVAVLTLALGIGANTAMFSIVNATLLRPPPFKDGARLLLLHEGFPKIGFPRMLFSPPDLAVFAREQKTFSNLGAFLNEHKDISGQGEPDRVVVSRVSASLFPMLGVQPVLGRTFAPEEDAPGHPVAILSDALWQSRYGGNPNILGQQIHLDREAYVVIGVMPRQFAFPPPGLEINGSPAGLWVPMAVTPAELQEWGGLYMTSVVGRLRPGLTLNQARTEVNALAPGILASYPASIRNTIPGFQLDLSASPFQEEMVGSVRTLLLLLMGAVSFVLLIACANIATLLLSRAAMRQKEIAIRAALGAARSRLARQMLTESFLLAFAGGALGLFLAVGMRNLLLAMAPSSIPLPNSIALSGSIFAFALLGSAFAAILFGLVPTLQVLLPSTKAPLQEGGRSGTPGRSHRRAQELFVIAEFALALVLMVGAGLLIRSFAKLLETSPGFRPDHLLTMNISLPRQAYSRASQLREFYEELLARTSTLPAVESATVSTDLPLRASEMVSFAVDGRSEDKGLKATCQTWVIGNYLRTMGIPLIQGRWFEPEDRAGSQPVAVISAYTARTMWPGQNAIGKRVRWGGGPWQIVVGVVGDVKEGPLDRPLVPHVYRPYNQADDGLIEEDPFSDWHAINLVIRTQTDPLSLTTAAVAQIRWVDPQLAVADIRTMTQVINSSVNGPKFNTFLLGAFAAVALFLAAIGVYGVLAYSVSRRTHEIGIRMALGARPTGVMRLILKEGTRLSLVGSSIGAVAAFFLMRLMSNLLYGVSPTDPLAFVGAAIVLTGVALLASILPARRATKVDPMVALRYE